MYLYKWQIYLQFLGQSVCVTLCTACYNGLSLQIKEFEWVDEHNPLLVNLFILPGHGLCVTEYHW